MANSAKLMAECKALKAKVNGLEETVRWQTAKVAESVALRSENEVLRADRDWIDDRLTAVKVSRDAANRRVGQLTSESEALTAQVATATRSIVGLEDRLSDAEAENASLRRSMVDNNGGYVKALGKVYDLEGEARRLKDQLRWKSNCNSANVAEINDLCSWLHEALIYEESKLSPYIRESFQRKLKDNSWSR